MIARSLGPPKLSIEDVENAIAEGVIKAPTQDCNSVLCISLSSRKLYSRVEITWNIGTDIE